MGEIKPKLAATMALSFGRPVLFVRMLEAKVFSKDILYISVFLKASLVYLSIDIR